MKILVIGGGGREHAIVSLLAKDPRVETLYVLPGNGGMAEEAECVNIGATDIDGIVEFVKENPVDFAVVAPDDPLALGAVDRLEEIGVKCFGPDKKAAQIEASKAFSKDLMKKYGIPTAKYETFTEVEPALNYIDQVGAPIVVKADGLALGKGVTVAETVEEARKAVHDLMEEDKFGEAGHTVVIEEYLTGPEVSVLAFSDGETIIPMVSSMDHKRAYDNDLGPNTGGMGTVAPNPFYTPEVEEKCIQEIFIPTIKAMKEEGRPFKGCLFFGLMITEDGPKVIEYNCRFGDPEAQVVLPLLKSNLLDILMSVRDETLSPEQVEFDDRSACCVVMASDGYPLSYDTGFEISLPELTEDQYVYIAGAKKDGDKLLTSGGRVLGAVALGDDLETAIKNAYALSDTITFENSHRREDIGKKALEVLEKS